MARPDPPQPWGGAFIPAGWSHWRPADYPIQDRRHNPWVPIDPISGKTACQMWNDDKSLTEDEFRAKINRFQGIQ